MPRLRPALALLALALTVPFAACGDGQDPVQHAATEGVYVTAGQLKYQVQVSRKLNPYDVEDRDYFTGVEDAKAQQTDVDQWYGVFIRVENRTDKGDSDGKTIQSASQFTIKDTTGAVVKPTTLPSTNVFAYRSTPIIPGDHFPPASSAAASAPIGGALILFKVPQTMLDNRPTQLVIKPVDGGDEATITLDV
ncbi:MAG: hypothetical protein J7513_08665 [Solirubrobacteraceae bacterium]|nr:hypothetical protein [Solirubrobacteraceae bacterium]